MSNVWARMLIAGTVNPETSPRPRAMYSSWMLADRAPSAWLASQTIQRAASAVGSSFVNAAVQARSAAASAAEPGLVVDDEPAVRDVGDAAQAGEEVGGRLGDVRHAAALLWVSLSMVAASRVDEPRAPVRRRA